MEDDFAVSPGLVCSELLGFISLTASDLLCFVVATLLPNNGLYTYKLMRTPTAMLANPARRLLFLSCARRAESNRILQI